MRFDSHGCSVMQSSPIIRGWNGRGEKDAGVWNEVIAVQLLNTFDLSLKPQKERYFLPWK
jgi:hypothetical protein